MIMRCGAGERGHCAKLGVPLSSCLNGRIRPAKLVSTAEGDPIRVKNIFVGNLDFNASEESLRALFEQYGAVERVNIVRDRDTGQPRGFAFVEMTDGAQADQAITELNGSTLGGRAMNVNEARPKTSGGGGGRSGGGFRSHGGGGGGRQRRDPRW